MRSRSQLWLVSRGHLIELHGKLQASNAQLGHSQAISAQKMGEWIHSCFKSVCFGVTFSTTKGSCSSFLPALLWSSPASLLSLPLMAHPTLTTQTSSSPCPVPSLPGLIVLPDVPTAGPFHSSRNLPFLGSQPYSFLLRPFVPVLPHYLSSP